MQAPSLPPSSLFFHVLLIPLENVELCGNEIPFVDRGFEGGREDDDPPRHASRRARRGQWHRPVRVRDSRHPPPLPRPLREGRMSRPSLRSVALMGFGWKRTGIPVLARAGIALLFFAVCGTFGRLRHIDFIFLRSAAFPPDDTLQYNGAGDGEKGEEGTEEESPAAPEQSHAAFGNKSRRRTKKPQLRKVR